MNKIISILKTVPSLIKYKVSLAVTFTTVIGYLIYTGSFSFDILALILSVFILAGGASALNEYQEKSFDALMDRTKHRPIPSGKLSPLNALLVSLLFIVAGVLLLYFFFGIVPALLGLFNIIWYNLLYTNLKKITAFAVVPGSLTGAVPALIGWTAAGGYIFDAKIIIIGFFLFIWQIPHFWLLLIKYSKEYETAGYPSIYKVIHKENLKLITFVWIIATSVTTLMFPLFHIITSIPFLIALLVLNIWLVITFTRLTFRMQYELNFKKAFITINLFMFLFMLLLTIGAFI